MGHRLLENYFPFSLKMLKVIFKLSIKNPEMLGNKTSFKLKELNPPFDSEASRVLQRLVGENRIHPGQYLHFRCTQRLT